MADANATPASGHAAHPGPDAGKPSHWAYAADHGGGVLPSRRAANSGEGLDALMAELPAGTPVVVDQRRDIGALAVRGARGAGRPAAHPPGAAEREPAGSLPGVAKTDERDAQAIARSAPGMPQTPRPVPAGGPAPDGARVMPARVARAQRDRTARADALRSRPPEPCPAFEAACDTTAGWCAGMLAELGGPWSMPGTGRERPCAASRRHSATREQRDRLWDAMLMPI